MLLTLARGEEVSLTGTTAEAAGEHLYWDETPVEVTISRELSPEERQRRSWKRRSATCRKSPPTWKNWTRAWPTRNSPKKRPPAVVAKARADLAELQHRRDAVWKSG